MATRPCPSCHEPVPAHLTVCLACRTPVPSEAGPIGDAASSRIWFAPPPPRQRGRRRDAGGDASGPTTTPIHQEAITTGPLPPDGRDVADPSHPGATAWAAPADATAVTWAPDPTHAPPSAPAPLPPEGAAWTPGPAVGTPSAGALGADAPALDDRGNLPAGAVGLVGSLLVVVGVFLPWLTVAGTDVSGWAASADAKVLLVVAGAATVVSALLVAGARGLLLRLVVLLLGVVTVALAAYDVVSVGDVDLAAGGGPSAGAEVGVGLLVVVAGGVGLTLAGLLTRHRRYR